MPTPTIPNGEEHFFVSTYEGNGAGKRVGKFVPFDDSSGGTIANSCIFNDDDSPKLHRQLSSGNRKTWTISLWFKLGKVTATDGAGFWVSSPTDDGAIGGNPSPYNMIFFQFVSGALEIQDYQDPSYVIRLKTNRTFEDTSKFYHLVLAVDTTQSTEADRVRMYIDGDEITSFATSTYPSLNADTNANRSGYYDVINIGYNAYWDGYMTEFNFLDGQQLTPASFGVTDTSTGRWIPAQVKPHPTTTTTYTVTVVGGNPSNHPYYNVGSTNKFAINGSTATADVDLTLYEGAIFRFDQSDSSNSGHPLRFSETAHGTHGGGSEYSTNVTVVGTPGTSGAYTEITVASSAPDLHYYCTNHNGMGYQASTPNGYGTNGFRLTFSDSSSLGADTSGNSNTFTATNLSASSQTTDSPTQNFSTLEGSSSGSMTLSEGNLRYTTASAGNWESVYNDKSISSGKWYFELTCKVTTAYDVQPGVILESLLGTNKNELMGYTDGSVGYNMDGIANTLYYGNNGNNYAQTTGTQVDAGDIVGVAYDADTGAMWFAKNNTWVSNGTGVGNPSTGANPTWVQGSFAGQKVRFGFSTNNASASSELNFGQKSFTYTPPTGFVALQQDNLPETAKGVSGLVWIKNRDATDSWIWQDSLRGKSEYGSSASATQYNTAITDGVQKFLKGGVQIEDNDAVNTSGESYVAFNWVLNNGTNVTDTSGDLSTELQANPTAGVSVGKFTVSGSGNKTWAHGLGGVPEVGILCGYDTTNSGTMYHHKTSATPYSSGLFLTNNSAVFSSSNIWGSAKPTSTLWTGLVGSLFSAGLSYIFYSFRGIDGFSKFGKYTGNGVVDGPFIYTGFKPRWLLHKANNGAGWYLYDSVREKNNPLLFPLFPNITGAESSNVYGFDFLSNGFKLRQPTGYGANYSGVDVYYMAFAEHPFIGDGTSPATAR